MNHAGMLLRGKKRSRPVEASARCQEEVKFKEVMVYLVEKKMGRSRRNFLTSLARSKGFRVDDVLSDEVTHVVAEDNQAGGLWSWLREQGLRDISKVQVLDISWFTESMREGRPVTVESRHHIQETLAETVCSTPAAVDNVSQYACQRRTTTENHNKMFTDALEVLAESSEFNENEGRCLAFRRAASVLKSLPSAVRSLGATQGLPCLGEHTEAVIEEILQFGRCFKVEEIQCDERYQALKLFTSVFGVGPKTAEKWYRRGLRSFKEILNEPAIQLNKMQRAGFLYYRDISKTVSKAEAQALRCIIEETVHWIMPDAILALTGGFRRGKEYGHDVDFLVTTPELGREEGLLLHVIDRLQDQGILLYCEHQGTTFDATKLPSCNFEAMDHFEKCFLIVRLYEDQVEGGLQRNPGDSRAWRAIRVDLVVPPVDRYATALLGWTGSRFVRDLRRFARKERRMLFDNHALYDKTKLTLTVESRFSTPMPSSPFQGLWEERVKGMGPLAFLFPITNPSATDRKCFYPPQLRKTSLSIWVWSMWNLGRETLKSVFPTRTPIEYHRGYAQYKASFPSVNPAQLPTSAIFFQRAQSG
ncbi:DNA nucleotidylexotransferase isoform X2 [Esox lucius]|uniref:DNA nucleotidylexotransferase isoform X2 n=1 Tax=Esox lucius TaxID=8010 RepID=UPI001476F41F|nr:DNA nucleotidylexotransferase isoform X2 [Esox lucius]